MNGASGPAVPMAHRTLLTTIAKFAGGNWVGNALTILSGLLLARYVGPEFANPAQRSARSPGLRAGVASERA